MIAKLEIFQDVLHVLREAIKVGLKVRLQLLAAGAGSQVAEREPRGVVESLLCGTAQCLFLLNHARFVERGFSVQNGFLIFLQHRIQPAQYRHRQNHIPILAAHIDVTQHVVGDAPDKVRYRIQIELLHYVFCLSLMPVIVGRRSAPYQAGVRRQGRAMRTTPTIPAILPVPGSTTPI